MNKLIYILLFLSWEAYGQKVKKTIIVYKYVKDSYGTYSPFSKEIIWNGIRYNFSDNFDDLYNYYIISCEHTNTNKFYDLLLSKKSKKNRKKVDKNLREIYNKKTIDSMSIDYRIYSNNIYYIPNSDTLLLIYGFSGKILKIDSALCEHFGIARPLCIIPEKIIDYPLIFLYKINKINPLSIKQINKMSIYIQKSPQKSISVSYCD